MNRADLQKVSMMRQREARALLDAGHFPGSFYLMGYAVECALKACFTKQIKRHDFPDKKLINDAYTHNLEHLVKTAGLEDDFKEDKEVNPSLELNWTTVKDWSESKRYDVDITQTQARDLYLACTAPKNGVLPWIRKRW